MHQRSRSRAAGQGIWANWRIRRAKSTDLGRFPGSGLPIPGLVDLENTLLTWLPIVFFGIVILLLLYTLRFMPRAKPSRPTSVCIIRTTSAPFS